MYKYVLFDLDGTLFDTLPDIYGALRFVFDKHSFKAPTMQETISFIGGGLVEFFNKALGNAGFNNITETEMKQYQKEYLEYYGVHAVQDTKPYDRMEEILQKMKENNVLMSVVSNKSEILVKKIVNIFGFEKYFTVIAGGDTYSEKKPSPVPLYSVLSIMSKGASYQKDQVIMVGDSKNDILAGYAADVKTCLCSFGYGLDIPKEPHYIINKPMELIDIVLK